MLLNHTSSASNTYTHMASNFVPSVIDAPVLVDGKTLVDCKYLDEKTMEEIPQEKYAVTMRALLIKANEVFNMALETNEAIPIFVKYAYLFCTSLGESRLGWQFAKEDDTIWDDDYMVLDMNVKSALNLCSNITQWKPFTQQLEYCEEMLYVMSK